MAEAETNIQLNETLYDLFRAHGIQAVLQDDWVAFPVSGMRASASVPMEIERPSVFTVEVEVRFEFFPEHTIVETLAGIGATREAAVADAFQNFAANSFHVLLAAFFRSGGGDAPDAGDQVSQEEWLLGNQARWVTFSNLTVRGKPPVQGEQLVGWFAEFQQRLQQQTLGPETHWVRLYYAQSEGEVLACEVLLDNAVWDAVQAQAATFDWPIGDDFYSLRVFLVIEGVDGNDPPTESLDGTASPTNQSPGARARPRSWRFWER